MATLSFKCSNCGGGLSFNPGNQTYKCEYCLSEFTQEQLDAMKPEAAKDQIVEDAPVQPVADGEQTAAADGGEAVIYNCPSCGAEIVTDATTAATFCYYCHNPVVLSGKLSGEYHPEYVLPFVIDKEKATKIFIDWIKTKKFVPKEFFSKDQIDKITGVYFPYWLYSCQVDGKLEGEGLKRRNWVTGSVQYTENQKYQVGREGDMTVDHVTRNALKKANKKLVEGVLPFEMEGLKPFTMGYLSGFLAENRDMNRQDFQQEVEAEVKDYAIDSLKSSAREGYDDLSISEQMADIVNPRWDYALLPVWTLTYKDKKDNQIYYFALNGQSGKICGELPADNSRLAGLFIKIFIPMVIVLLIAGYFI